MFFYIKKKTIIKITQFIKKFGEIIQFIYIVIEKHEI